MAQNLCQLVAKLEQGAAIATPAAGALEPADGIQCIGALPFCQLSADLNQMLLCHAMGECLTMDSGQTMVAEHGVSLYHASGTCPVLLCTANNETGVNRC